MSIHSKSSGTSSVRFLNRDLLKKAFSGMAFSRLRNRSWRTKAGIFLVFVSLVCGFMTYAALRKAPPFGDDPNLVIWLLNVDLILLLLLTSLIAYRIVAVWSSKRRGIAGSHLHVRLVYIFCTLVAVPTVIMTIFSASFFHYGVQAWFSQRVQTAINESSAVAQAYLEEHKQVIQADTMAMANDLDRQGDRLLLDEKRFAKVMDSQSFFRNLSEAVVIERSGRVLARSALAFSLEYETPHDYSFQRANDGDVVLIMSEDQDRVRALVKLQSFANGYLFVGRMIDPNVLEHLQSARLAVEDYNNLQMKYASLQITVTLIFVVVAMLLLLAAIWSGLLLARQLVNPIGELITAADRVRAGDFSSRLPETKRLEEFEYLARSFNRMTEQIQSQRNDLIEANLQIDRRRRLTETVLAGISSAVIGVDHHGLINLANISATTLLSRDIDDVTGQFLLDVLPELKPLLDKVAKKPKKMVQEEISVLSGEGGRRTFLFKISIEVLEENKTGLIITFDDITELQSAQRKAAWSDVARRIAHEIKNPLTPIQLSAERLQKKYLKDIKNSPETFEQCTDTIIKHVGDIGKMVDEFSSFARMPEPVLTPEVINKQIKDSLILIRQAHPQIAFSFTSRDDYTINLDARQIRQVMNNLLKNATEALTNITDGAVDIFLGQYGDEVFVAVSDNGEGFPNNEEISKLTEPYITHKSKGTGLGLAIVKKIMDEHNGRLILGTPEWLKKFDGWRDQGGACLVLTFPFLIDAEKEIKFVA